MMRYLVFNPSLCWYSSVCKNSEIMYLNPQGICRIISLLYIITGYDNNWDRRLHEVSCARLELRRQTPRRETIYANTNIRSKWESNVRINETVDTKVR